MIAIQYWHVCLVSLLAGTIQLALLILVCALKLWISFTSQYGNMEHTVNIGAFALDILGVSIEIPSEGGIATLKAMLILSILVLAAGIVAQIISTMKKEFLCCGPLLFMRISEGLYLLSGIFLMIGIIEYQKFWGNAALNFGSTVTWHFSSAYRLAWAICIMFLLFVLAKIIYVNFILDIKGLTSKRSRQEVY